MCVCVRKRESVCCCLFVCVRVCVLFVCVVCVCEGGGGLKKEKFQKSDLRCAGASSLMENCLPTAGEDRLLTGFLWSLKVWGSPWEMTCHFQSLESLRGKK